MENLNYLSQKSVTKVDVFHTLFSKIYFWMTVALLTTAGVAYWTVANIELFEFMYTSKWYFFGLIMLQLFIVGGLSGAIFDMKQSTAEILFILYSGLTGFTFSSIFIIFTVDSIAFTFLVTASTFALMSIYGFITKSDLSKWGKILLMGVLGLIVSSIINIFYDNSTFYWVTSYLGVVIFVGLIAFDTQKIKILAEEIDFQGDEINKLAILGALTLYLDFVNLFLYLLRFFGKKK
jgi:FtsH-binding integral membrane protein